MAKGKQSLNSFRDVLEVNEIFEVYTAVKCEELLGCDAV
jgi:hypothetical protein